MYAGDMVVITLVNGKLSYATIMAECVVCCITDDGEGLQFLTNVLHIAYSYTRRRVRIKGNKV
jgi:hypothetical protein